MQHIAMKTIIGIDDTDNPESRGTGHLVRNLCLYLSENGIFKTDIIVRHQLYVHPSIPYTSHNSAASVSGTLLTDHAALSATCATYLLENAAMGSDAGLCIIGAVSQLQKDRLISWGLRAKKEILTEAQAYNLAKACGIFLEGVTGRKTGVIGALAATGLLLSGEDGRVLWMNELRETEGLLTAADIKKRIGIDLIMTTDNQILSENDLVYMSNWNRPIMRNHKTVFFVEQHNNNNNEYQTASKHFIKSLSE